MTDKIKRTPLKNESNKGDELVLNNQKFEMKTFFNSEYIKEASQVPFLNHICVDIVEEMMQWLSERRAQTMFYKAPDIMVFDQKGTMNWEATKKLHEIQRERNLKEELFYQTEKALCYNDLAINLSHAIWTVDVDVEGTPFATFVDRNSILEIGNDKISNSAVQCKIKRDVFKDSSGYIWYLVEERNIDFITTSVATFSNGKLSLLEAKNIPDEVQQNYQDKLGKREWKYPVVPFVYIKNTQQAIGDVYYIRSNLYKEIMLRGQEYIETLVSGTKVVTDSSSNHNLKKSGDNNNNKAKILEAATSPVIERSRSLTGNSVNPQIAYGQPTLDVYERARKANKNEMLQKIGAATDVDSKGSVQQNDKEILRVQGDEFKLIQWKNSHRQEKVRELMDKFAQILKIEAENNKKWADFKNYERVQVLLAQNEIISERDLIENLSKAKELGVIDDIIAVARFNKINLYEARELIQARKDGLE